MAGPKTTRARIIASLTTCAALAVPAAAGAQEVIELAPVVVDSGTAAGTGAPGGTGNIANTDAVRGELDRTSIVADTSTVGTKTGTPIIDTPQSVSVVTQAEMEQRGVTNLDEALAYTPGVSTDVYGSDNRYDHFLIRGFYQTSYGRYRDGLSLRNSANFTSSRYEPYALSRIEVLKGSTSSLFGLNGPGGLVNGITKVPLEENFGEVYATFGDRHGEAGTDFGGALDAEKTWLYRFTTKAQNGIDDIPESNDDRVLVAPAITWQPTDMTAVTLLMDYNKRNGDPSHGVPYRAGLDPDTFLGEPTFDRFETEEWNVGWLLRHDFGNGLQFRQNARYTDIDLDYETVYNARVDPTIPRNLFGIYGDVQRATIDNQLQYDGSWRFIDTKTLLGFDYFHDEGDEYRVDATVPGIDVYNPQYCGPQCIFPLPQGFSTHSRSNAFGLYAQEEATFYDKLILTFGGRYDNVRTYVTSPSFPDFSARQSEEAWTGRAGATYKLRPELAVYANYSESFQPVSPGATFPGGTEPQEGTQYEVGIKYAPEFLGGRGLFTVAAFDLTQTNVPFEVTTGVNAQVGEIRVRGIEEEGKFAITDRLNTTLGYSYWDPEIREDGITGNKGNRPQNVPNHIASGWVDYTIPGRWQFGDLTLGAGIRYFGNTYADNANTIKLDDRVFVDAALTYEVIDNLDLQVNVTNLFDQRYVTHVDTFSNTAFYNDGATVFGTVKYRW